MAPTSRARTSGAPTSPAPACGRPTSPTPRSGCPPRVGAVILGVALLAAIACGLAIGWAVNQVRDRFTSDEWDQVTEGASLGFTLLLLVGLIVWKGFDVAIKVVAVVYVALVAILVVANLIADDFEWLALVRATALIVFLMLAIVAGMLGRVVGGVFGIWSVVLVAVFGGLATGQSEGGIAGVVVAVSLALISKRTVRGDPRDRTLRKIAHRMIRRWGTQFVDADLTGADFTGTRPHPLRRSRCDGRRRDLGSRSCPSARRGTRRHSLSDRTMSHVNADTVPTARAAARNM